MTNSPLLRSDFIVPFQLEQQPIRGRLLRLSAVLDDILSKHNYPDEVSMLLAEAVTLVVMLGSWLKYDGIFTLQAQGSGPVNLLVADYTSSGAVRGYARFDSEKISIVPKTFGELLGEGLLSFTIDQGDDTDRYQGIVSIEGDTLSEAIGHYFAQSEQLRTQFQTVIEKDGQHWHSAAISIQALPDEDQGMGDDDPAPENWNNAVALLSTASPDELLNQSLHPHELLFRLFHEGGVRGFPEVAIRHNCRCSMDRASFIMASLSENDLTEFKINNDYIELACEFCNSTYRFSGEALEKMKEKARE